MTLMGLSSAGLGRAVAACLDGSLLAFEVLQTQHHGAQKQEIQQSLEAGSNEATEFSMHMEEAWRYECPAPILSAPVIDDERHLCIAATVSGQVCGISVTEGMSCKKLHVHLFISISLPPRKASFPL